MFECVRLRAAGLRPTILNFAEGKIRRYKVPADFELAHGAKYALDTQLYRFALQKFRKHLDQHPECKIRRPPRLSPPPSPPDFFLLVSPPPPPSHPPPLPALPL